MVIVSSYGCGSGGVFIKIAVSQDEGKTWFLSDSVAKNNAIEDYFKTAFYV